MCWKASSRKRPRWSGRDRETGCVVSMMCLPLLGQRRVECFMMFLCEQPPLDMGLRISGCHWPMWSTSVTGWCLWVLLGPAVFSVAPSASLRVTPSGCLRHPGAYGWDIPRVQHPGAFSGLKECVVFCYCCFVFLEGNFFGRVGQVSRSVSCSS